MRGFSFRCFPIWAWAFLLPADALAQTPSNMTRTEIVAEARQRCIEEPPLGQLTPAYKREFVRFLGRAEIVLGREMNSYNISATGARYLLDGKRQRFEVPIIPATASPPDVATPYRIRAWVRSGNMDPATADDQIELRVAQLASVLPASRWRADAQLQRHLAAEIVIPSRPSLWHTPVETSVMILGCPLGTEEEPWVARYNADMSSGRVAMLATMLVGIFFYWLLIRASPARQQNAIIVKRMKSQGRNISKTLEWRTKLDPVMLTQSAAGHGQLNIMQVWFFTTIIAILLTYVMLRAGYLADLSLQVLQLLGIASAGSALATAITNARTQGEVQPPYPRTIDFLERIGALNVEDRFGSWSDLVNEGGNFGVHKFQVLVFSSLVGLWLLLKGWNDLATFTIPDSILGLLGISQVIYVAGKGLAPAVDWKPLNDAVAVLTKGETPAQVGGPFSPIAGLAGASEAADTLLTEAPKLLARYRPVKKEDIVAPPLPQ